MTGIRKFAHKERRRIRRQNSVAKDLKSPKYHQRVVKKRRLQDESWSMKDWLNEEDQ